MKRFVAGILICVLLAAALPMTALAATVYAKAIKLPITKAQMDLAGKVKGRIIPKLSPSNANEPLIWRTSDPAIATVDVDGIITAKGVGTCTIGARGQNTSWAKCKITVINTGSTIPSVPSQTGAAPVVKLKLSSTTLDKNGRKSVRIGYSCSKSGAAIEWRSNNTAVATVDATGTVTATGKGNCIIGARAEGGKWAKCKVTVVNTAKAKSLDLSAEAICIAPGQTTRLEVSILPAAAEQNLKWKVADSSIATVDQSGNIRGIRRGTTAVRVAAVENSKVTAIIPLVVSTNAPTAIETERSIYTVAKGTTFDIAAKAVPATAEQGLKYVSSDTKIAKVSSTGRVRAGSKGKAIIRIYSAESSAIYASVGVKVVDAMPTSITFSTDEFYFAPGDSATLQPTIKPDNCPTGVSYVSSNASVVSVDANGRIKAIAPGSARITATTDLGKLQASAVVTVLKTSYTTEVPSRYTSVAGKKGNLARIDAVAQSAYNALDNEIKMGSISATEAASRKTQIKRAFAMYRFPWMTTTEQPYWRKSSSLNGAKDFKTGRLYYGLPYIQYGKSGNFNARRFNEQNAVSGGYYTYSSKGYYLMSQTKRNDGMYAGNDCSAFVSLAMWGLNHAHSFDVTSDMLRTTVYKTVPWGRDMMPGDILVMDGHCVMFLYYTNAAQTQMMIIEQGGGNASDIHNTVCCTLVNVASYRSSGYIIRRPASYK